MGAGVQGLRKQLFSSSRLSVEQYRRIIVRNESAPFFQGNHNGILRDDVIQSIQISLLPSGKPFSRPVFFIENSGSHGPDHFISG